VAENEKLKRKELCGEAGSWGEVSEWQQGAWLLLQARVRAA
jgi:hypothetical protein